MRRTVIIAAVALTACSDPAPKPELAIMPALRAIWSGDISTARQEFQRVDLADGDPTSCRARDVQDWSSYHAAIGLESLVSYAAAGASKPQLVAIARADLLERLDNIEGEIRRRCGGAVSTDAPAVSRMTVRDWVAEGERDIATWEADLARAERDYQIIKANDRIRECDELRAELDAPAESRTTGALREAQEYIFSNKQCSYYAGRPQTNHPSGFPIKQEQSS